MWLHNLLTDGLGRRGSYRDDRDCSLLFLSKGPLSLLTPSTVVRVSGLPAHRLYLGCWHTLLALALSRLFWERLHVDSSLPSLIQ